jgi:hypothetical protein
MPLMTLDLTDAEITKLAQLARARGKSPEACIKDFIASCQPGGSGWKHPEAASSPKNPKKPEKKA